MLPHLLALSLAIAPNLVSAALFPENTLVKMIDHKGFKNALKQNVCSSIPALIDSTDADLLHYCHR